MTASLSQYEAALRIGRSYDWFRKNWRKIQGFPRPYIGAEPGQRARWTEAAIDRFMSGEHFPATAEPLSPAQPKARKLEEYDAGDRYRISLGISPRSKPGETLKERLLRSLGS